MSRRDGYGSPWGYEELCRNAGDAIIAAKPEEIDWIR
jgi:hypothetical protein